MDNGFEGSKFLGFAQGVSERRRFRGCGVSLGRLGFAGGLGVMEAASAGSLGPIGRFRFWKSNYNTGFSFKRVIFARLKKAIWGCGVGLGPFGFAGGLVRGSAASLGPIGRFRFGRQINTGFSFKWSWCRMSHWEPHECFFWGIEAWKRRQNPDARFGG